MKNGTRAVFFDIDGTLLDSLRVGYEGTSQVFLSVGLTAPTFDEYLEHFDAHNALNFYHSRGVQLSLDEIWARFSAYYESHDHPLFEEVPKVLESLYESGVLIFFATFGRSEARIRELFKKHRIDAFFAGGGFGLERKSDYIDSVLVGADISPRNAAMIGDQPSDMLDAARSGLHLRVGVARDVFTKRKLQSQPQTHIIGNLTELFDIL